MVPKPATIPVSDGRRRSLPERLALWCALAGAMVAGVTLAAPSPADAAKVYRVPSRIDSTGNRDVSRELNSFIASVPNGSIIRFKRNGVYRLRRGGIMLRDRRNLVLNGRGAKLKSYGCDPQRSPIALYRSTGITVRNFILAGNNGRAGTRDAHRGGCEHQPGVAIYASADTLIENSKIRRTNGDCVYVAEGMRNGRQVWSDGVTFRDSTCVKNGRMGVAVVGGRDVAVVRNTFRKIAMYVLDIEPNSPRGGGAQIRFRNNKIGTYTIDRSWSPYFFAANGSPGKDNVRNVRVVRNRVTGGTLRSVVSIRTRRSITFKDNISTVPANGPVLHFRYVRGLTVVGNVQPLRSGPLARIRNSSDVTYRP